MRRVVARGLFPTQCEVRIGNVLPLANCSRASRGMELTLNTLLSAGVYLTVVNVCTTISYASYLPDDAADPVRPQENTASSGVAKELLPA